MEMVILLFNCFIHCSILTLFCIIIFCSYRNYGLRLRNRFTKKKEKRKNKKELFSYVFEDIAYSTKTMKIYFNSEIRQHFLERYVSLLKNHYNRPCHCSILYIYIYISVSLIIIITSKSIRLFCDFSWICTH